MKTNKILIEQLNTNELEAQRAILEKAKELKCFPSWLKDGNFGDYKGKKVYYGKNSKNETVVFYSDMTAENIVNGNKGNWKCDVITPEKESPYKKSVTYTNLIKYRNEVSEKDPSTPEFITSCENLVNTYYIAAGEPVENRAIKSPLPLSKSDLESVKVQMRACKGVFKKNYKFFTSDVQKKYDTLIYLPPFETANKEMISYQIRERVENDTLKKVVKNNLMEISEIKNKTLISENKIITNRLNILVENVSIITEEDKEKIFDKVVTETFYLKSQGYNNELINESFWDVLGGIFGTSFSNIGNTFKEYMVRWFIKKFTPLDPEGWMADIISISIGNIGLSDLNKLTDCKFLSKIFTKSIGEVLIERIKKNAGFTGGFYDVLRNVMVDALDNTEFAKKLEDAIGSLICPLVSNVKEKMEDKAEEMKTGAMGA